MLSDAIRATREHLAVHREPVTEGLLTTLQAYEVEARSLEFEIAILKARAKPLPPFIDGINLTLMAKEQDHEQ